MFCGRWGGHKKVDFCVLLTQLFLMFHSGFFFIFLLSRSICWVNIRVILVNSPQDTLIELIVLVNVGGHLGAQSRTIFT